MKGKTLLEKSIENGKEWSSKTLNSEDFSFTAQSMHVKNDLLYVGLTGSKDESYFHVYNLDDGKLLKEAKMNLGMVFIFFSISTQKLI